jgi:hypothetical protein
MTELWKGVPPKEGRPSSLARLLIGRRRRPFLRLGLVILLGGVLYLILTSASSTSSTLPDLAKAHINERSEPREPRPVKKTKSEHNSSPGKKAKAQRVLSQPAHKSKPDHASPLDSKAPVQRAISGYVSRTQELNKIKTTDIQPLSDNVLEKQVPLMEAQKANTSFKPDSRLEAALVQVISLLPNEITTRGLLQPIDGTGEEKLHEIGLRARAYKTYFEAWEELHLIRSGEDVYIRDDVIQYLRERAESSESISSNFAQTVRTYESYRYFLNRLSSLLFPWTAPYFADHMRLHTYFKTGGRGIVLSGGNDQAAFLLTSIASFRRLGCNLPIEIMYLGETDLSEDNRLKLEKMHDVITRDMSQMVADDGWKLEGWAGKPFAILLSSFREVIFIDADALFFHNPEILFDDPDYAETGALFFRDRIIMPENRKKFMEKVLPRPISNKAKQSRFWTGESGHMQESGVVVVDKWKHLVALLMVTRMNGPDRDGNEEEGIVGVYDLVYGMFSTN